MASCRPPALRHIVQLLSFGVIGAFPLQAQAESALETIIVTANRSAQAGADVSLAFSSIDEESIALTGAQHSNQLLVRSAGTWVSRGNGQESLISIRSPVLTGAGSCGAFVSAADGISLRAPGFCNVNQLFDANLLQATSVEVIRGPGTTVFGSNAMHGVINVLSGSAENTPNQLAIEAGSRDFYRVSAQLSSPQYGTVLRVQSSEYGGYQDNSGYAQQKLHLRHDREIDGWDITAALAGSNLNQETAGYIQGFESYESDSAREENPNPEAFRDAWSTQGYLRGSRALKNDLDLTVTAYLRKNRMAFLQHYLIWKPDEQNGHESIGMQISLADQEGPITWIAGIDLDATEGWLTEYQEQPFSPNQPAGLHYDYTVDATVAGAFWQGQLSWGGPWRIDAGLRYESTEYDYDNRTGTGDACAETASACRFFRPADRRDRFNDWSGNVAIAYDFEQSSLFARLAKGFRPPQTAELYRLQAGQAVAEIDSEELDSVEIGLRGNSGNGINYAVTAYFMEKNNVIFQDRDRQNVSGAETAHRGIEVELNWQFNERWYAELAASVADHEYSSDITVFGSRGNIEGNTIDTAPKHFGSARLGTEQLIASHPVRAELEWVWISDYYLDPNNEHQYGGHNLLNARFELVLSPKLTATLVATNLFDRGYAERADFGFGSYRYFVGEPRSAVMGLRWSLD